MISSDILKLVTVHSVLTIGRGDLSADFADFADLKRVEINGIAACLLLRELAAHA